MSDLSDRTRLLIADGVLVGVTLAWGTSFALVKEALEHTSPANFLFLRFALACLVLGPVAWRRRRFWSSRFIWPGVVVGFFLFGAFISQAFGLVFTTASRSGFITGLNVILVPLLTIVLFRRLPPRQALVGAGLAFGGLYLLTSADSVQGMPFNLGDTLTLVCAFMAAGHILALGRYSPRCDPFWLTFIQLLVVELGGLGWAAAAGELAFDLPREVYAAAAWLAAACTIFAFWGQTWAQVKTTPTRTAIIFTLEPVFAALFAWWWLSERLGLWGLAGAALILGGILLAEVRTKAWTLHAATTLSGGAEAPQGRQ